MNPLAVSRRLAELVDPLLRHRQPAGRGDFAAPEILQRLQGFKHEGWHGYRRLYTSSLEFAEKIKSLSFRGALQAEESFFS